MSATTIFAPTSSTRLRNSTMARWLTYGSIAFADLCAFSAAGVLAVFTRYIFPSQFTPGDWLTFAPCLLVFFFVFGIVGLYPGIAVNPIEEFRHILRASIIVFLLIIGATFFLRSGLMSSRIVFLLAWLYTVVLVPVTRRLIRSWSARHSWWGIPAVIMGDRESGVMMLEMLVGHPRLGLRPVALLLDGAIDSLGAHVIPPDIFAGELSHANALALDLGHCYAVIAMPSTGSERIKRVFTEHANEYHRVMIIPDLFGISSLAVSAKDVCGILTFEVEQKISRKLPQLAKRGFDLSICLVVALLALPVFMLICLAIGLTSRGPLFYGQRRIGRNERPFRVWKFRTMVVNADEVLQKYLDSDPALHAEWMQDHKLRRDPRVTRVGRLLRKCSLDELPQIWNVICGQMSLVGPRPIVQSEVDRYGHIFRQYRRVIPGITGLWQISGRNNTTYERRIQIDDYYVRNWSLELDLYILLRTLKTVFLSEGAY